MTSIDFSEVTVEFPVRSMPRSLRGALATGTIGGAIRSGSRGRQVITALENVSFDIREGERVALLGANGAGKSTLLRTMAEIYHPRVGSVRIAGRVSALFDTSLGMSAEDSGEEAIVAMGLLAGMTLAEIDQKFDDVVRFTELGEYLRMPVRTYSSGMRLRLAFAVATAIDPEILLIDEGLGAGDPRFTEKAKSRVETLITRAPLLVLASQSVDLVRKFCDKAIYLERGRLAAIGSLDHILEFVRFRDYGIVT